MEGDGHHGKPEPEPKPEQRRAGTGAGTRAQGLSWHWEFCLFQIVPATVWVEGGALQGHCVNRHTLPGANLAGDRNTGNLHSLWLGCPTSGIHFTEVQISISTCVRPMCSIVSSVFLVIGEARGNVSAQGGEPVKYTIRMRVVESWATSTGNAAAWKMLQGVFSRKRKEGTECAAGPCGREVRAGRPNTPISLSPATVLTVWPGALAPAS